MFPSALPSFTTPTSGETLQAGGHTALHVGEDSNIVAIATKVGTGASTPTNDTVLRGNGTGTTIYDQVHLSTDVSGVLPTSNGGTGTTSTTGTGAIVLQTSPTINNPTLSNPTESGGTYNTATLNAPTIVNYPSNSIPPTALQTAIPSSLLYNPYKFSVYRNASYTTGGALPGTTAVVFDTKSGSGAFDTGGNFSTSTGLFTAPIAGFYQFNAFFLINTAGGNGFGINLIKNGAASNVGFVGIQGATAGFGAAASVSALLQLAANDTVGVNAYNGASGTTGAGGNGFQGFLVSAT